MASQCEVLCIEVDSRTSILRLINNLINLRTLIVRCKEFIRPYRILTRSNHDEYDDVKLVDKNEIIVWLKESLQSTSIVVSCSELTDDINIWI